MAPVTPGSAREVAPVTPGSALDAALLAPGRALDRDRRRTLARRHHTTVAEVNARARALGAPIVEPAPWTEADDLHLTRIWPEFARRQVCEAFPGRSWEAIKRHALGLGLQLGLQQGFVSLTQAAEDEGLTLRELRRILTEEGVEIHAHPRRAQCRARSKRSLAAGARSLQARREAAVAREVASLMEAFGLSMGDAEVRVHETHERSNAIAITRLITDGAKRGDALTDAEARLALAAWGDLRGTLTDEEAMARVLAAGKKGEGRSSPRTQVDPDQVSQAIRRNDLRRSGWRVDGVLVHARETAGEAAKARKISRTQVNAALARAGMLAADAAPRVPLGTGAARKWLREDEGETLEDAQADIEAESLPEAPVMAEGVGMTFALAALSRGHRWYRTEDIDQALQLHAEAVAAERRARHEEKVRSRGESQTAARRRLGASGERFARAMVLGEITKGMRLLPGKAESLLTALSLHEGTAPERPFAELVTTLTTNAKALRAALLRADLIEPRCRAPRATVDAARAALNEFEKARALGARRLAKRDRQLTLFGGDTTTMAKTVAA
ncbi:MAG: hypothetical protein JNK72_25010 [Myxococcales bacterium]|nr:hypothetical protein [Myxococcales bacterium]